MSTPITIHRRNPAGIVVALLLAAGTVAFTPHACADVAYTTLSGSLTYNPSGGYVLTGSSTVVGYFSQASSFQPVIGGNLSSIKVGVQWATEAFGEGDGDFVLKLEANNPEGGPLTTLVLASGNVSTSSLLGDSNSALVTFDYSGPNVTLIAGETYWIVLVPADANTVAVWSPAESGVFTIPYISTDGVNYQANGSDIPNAFEVDVIPEPGSYALFGLGVIFLSVHVVKGRARRVAMGAIE